MGFGGNCYQLQNRGITTWPEGEQVCRSLGGHLTSIHSKAEEDFLADLRLPGVQDSGLNLGMGGPNRGQRVIDKARAEQAEYERRQY